MSPLDTQKRLLVAESEQNRVELLAAASDLKASAQPLFEGAKAAASLASFGAVWVAKLGSPRSNQPPKQDSAPSWTQTLLRGLGLVSTIWLAVRSRRKGDRPTEREQ